MTDSAQIGVTGLAVMGRNLARNFARNGYTVAVHNRTDARTRRAGRGVRPRGRRSSPAETAEDFVAALERPRRLVIMVKAGDADRRGDRGVRAAAGARRHHHRRRQRALRGHPAPRGGAARAGHPLRRHRHLRRRGGRAATARASCRAAPTESYDVARPDAGEDLREGVDGDALLHARRPGRRRALREDGAQRHRVRRHAADRARRTTCCGDVAGLLRPREIADDLPRLEHRAASTRT